MFLRRLTIAGFKSFAAKTTLEFEPGMIAIVGPNGSGKSNVADAVRWVLGEQSSKTLRTKKGEEVIFAGTEKKAKGSMAEVSLLLDNTDNRMNIDFSEVEIARRLYRSGESEYRLNGRKVALRDIQQLLIQAGFGPNSYSVIGQGMIDQLILASPPERKQLFDEASGIRGYELKREQALHKLEATDSNLLRIRDILTELEPRLQTLGRSAESAQARSNLTEELSFKRAQYVNEGATHYQSQRLAAQETSADLKRSIAEAEKQVATLEARRTSITVSVPIPELAELQPYEAKRDQLSNELGVKKAELQLMTDKQEGLAAEQARTSKLEQDLARAKRTRQSLTRHLAEAQVEESETADQLAKIAKTIDRTQSKLLQLRKQTDQTSRQEYIAHALSILKQISYSLTNEPAMTKEEMRLLVYKAGRLLSHASRGQNDMVASIRQTQAELTTAMKQREVAHEPYTSAVIKVRSLELDLTHQEEQVNQVSEQLASLKQFKGQLKTTQRQIAQRQQHIVQLEEELGSVNETVQRLRELATKQAEVQTDTEEIFQLASELELAKARLSNLSGSQAETLEKLKNAEAGSKEMAELRRRWFKADKLPEVSKVNRPLAELEREVMVLEARLDETQAADAQTLEEYQETTERYQFLQDQVTDLETAQGDLQKVVAQLDKLIKTKFESAFAEMGQHFTAYFSQLFSGGKASLTLRPDSLGTYGIEIKAVPPGKRVESLATLSGGERALTGTALLAAILTINPSPFVVLDEIDAALDEANSARLSQILASLTKHSQLIVITHNRQIMASARALYGVTMDTHHASKVLSVRLETASQMAARK